MKANPGALAALLLLWLGPAGAAPLGDEVIDKSAQAKKEYEEGHYEQALQLYRQAQIEAPDTPALNFNVGSALFKTGDLPGAAKEFDQALEGADPALQARSFYNLGNTYYQQQQYQQAVEAYKQTLELDWQDQDAKANLELALSKQQEQQEQEPSSQDQKKQGQEKNQQQGNQPQQSQQDQQQQSPNQQNQQQQQPPNQQSQQEQQDQQDQQERQSQEQRQGKDPRAGQRNHMDREQAEQLLDALRDREKQAHQRRQRATQAYRGQDW